MIPAQPAQLIPDQEAPALPRVIAGVSWSPSMQYQALDLQKINDFVVDDTGLIIAPANPGRLALYVEYLDGSQSIQLNINDQSSTTVSSSSKIAWSGLPIIITSVYNPLLAQQSWRAVAAAGLTVTVRVWEVTERQIIRS